MAGRKEINVDITAKDDASSKLDDVADKAEKLEKLDPEVDVSADTATAEANIEQVSDDAKALSKQDTELIIRAKIDQAKGEIRELQADLDKLNTTDAGGGVRDFSSDVGEAHEATGEFVGEAVAELPGVGDALGPGAESMSQLVEGLISGKFAAQEFVATLVPLAAAFVAFKGITDHMAKMERIDAFNKAEVEAFNKALQAGDDISQSLLDKWREAAKIEFTNPLLGVQDLAPLLEKAGLSAVAWAEAIEGGKPAVDALEQTIGKLNLTENEQQVLVAALRVEANNLAIAQENQARIAALTADETDKLSTKTEQAAKAAKDAKSPTDDFNKAVAQTADDAGDAADELERLRGQLNLDTVADRADDALRTLNETIVLHGDDWEAVDDAARDAKGAVLDYAETLKDKNLLPPEIETKVIAAVDAGDLAEANRLLNDAAKTRTATINLDVVPNPSASDELRFLRNVGGTSTVNVNLPRGYRGDVVAEVTGGQRRNGRRYGARSVRYARR